MTTMGSNRAVTPSLRNTRQTGPAAPTIESLRAPTSKTNQTSQIISLESARKYLHAQNVAVGKMETLEEIGQTLLNISSSMSVNSTLQDAIRATVYFLLGVHDAKDKMEAMVERKVAEGMGALSERIEVAVEQAVTKAMENKQVEGELSGFSGTQTSQSSSLTSSDCQALSYAMALARTPPSDHAANVAKTDSRARGIFLDRAADAPETQVSTLSERALVEKANLALRNMGDLAADMPTGSSFRSAKKMKNGGIWVEMGTQQQAEWLRQEDTLRAFLQHWDGGCSTARSHRFPVIAMSVPVSHNPDSGAANREIEKTASLPAGSILSTRWIKPPERREVEQSHAHLLLTFSTPDAANEAMWNGLVVEGAHVNVRKLTQDVHRCLKCHQLGASHQASACPATMDVCGTCGENHRTKACAARDRQKFFCVNCKVSGHGAWDRQCPAFLNAQARFDRIIPGNAYMYYPTKDPRSWAKVNDTTPHSTRTNQPSAPSRQPRSHISGANAIPLGTRTPPPQLGDIPVTMRAPSQKQRVAESKAKMAKDASSKVTSSRAYKPQSITKFLTTSASRSRASSTSEGPSGLDWDDDAFHTPTAEPSSQTRQSAPEPSL